MCPAARVLLVLSLFLETSPALWSQKSSALRGDQLAHFRDELGVNEFTSPSIELVFAQLEALKPIPFDKSWRELPDSIPQDRARLALSAGQVIADGFLAISAHKQSRIEPVTRLLLRLAKGLGVGDPISKRSRGVLEMAAREKWTELQGELARSQAEVESSMLALKDEELAHLVSLGGWVRGLEITSSLVADAYTEPRARVLVQPELFDYFSGRVATLNPNLKKTLLIGTFSKNLAAIAELMHRPASAPLTLEEIKTIRDLAREMNKAVSVPEL